MAHGLGYSFVQTDIEGMPGSNHFFITATPIDNERIHLDIAAAAQNALPGLSLIMREVAY